MTSGPAVLSRGPLQDVTRGALRDLVQRFTLSRLSRRKQPQPGASVPLGPPAAPGPVSWSREVSRPRGGSVRACTGLCSLPLPCPGQQGGFAPGPPPGSEAAPPRAPGDRVVPPPSPPPSCKAAGLCSVRGGGGGREEDGASRCGRLSWNGRQAVPRGPRLLPQRVTAAQPPAPGIGPACWGGRALPRPQRVFGIQDSCPAPCGDERVCVPTHTLA